MKVKKIHYSGRPIFSLKVTFQRHTRLLNICRGILELQIRHRDKESGEGGGEGGGGINLAPFVVLSLSLSL